MERVRFQGVGNVVRFNWHYYLLAAGTAGLLVLLAALGRQPLLYLAGLIVALPIVISIAVSFFVYDRSDLYTFRWVNGLGLPKGRSVVNIHAGFDETSEGLMTMFPGSEFRVFDFYNPDHHTERSIRRARRDSGVGIPAERCDSSHLPLPDDSAHVLFMVFSAHEIRDDSERVTFFREVSRVAGDSGRIVVTEHLRDAANLLAYNVGAFHFLARLTWLATFEGAGLKVIGETKTTPFVTTFVLARDGTAT